MNLKTIALRLFGMLSLLGVLAACNGALLAPTPPTSSSAGGAGPIASSIGKRTKTNGCQINGKLPDSACTPGAILGDATKEAICVPGYSSKTRDVTTREKDEVYAEYGIKTHSAGEYEIDHLISLELGGSNGIANLWPEAADPKPGFHEKDKVENYMHDQVCSGAISLEQAQVEIATNWLQIYDKMPRNYR